MLTPAGSLARPILSSHRSLNTHNYSHRSLNTSYHKTSQHGSLKAACASVCRRESDSFMSRLKQPSSRSPAPSKPGTNQSLWGGKEPENWTQHPPPQAGLYRLEQSILGKCLHQESRDFLETPPPPPQDSAPCWMQTVSLFFNVPNRVTNQQVALPLISFMCIINNSDQ